MNCSEHNGSGNSGKISLNREANAAGEDRRPNKKEYTPPVLSVIGKVSDIGADIGPSGIIKRSDRNDK